MIIWVVCGAYEDDIQIHAYDEMKDAICKFIEFITEDESIKLPIEEIAECLKNGKYYNNGGKDMSPFTAVIKQEEV
tara:strand:+ start:1403 stop:1630 length:228 start_codon:yes stop_codon:yes gene_type:complete